MGMLAQESNTGRQAELLALQAELGKIAGVAEVFRDIDRARDCRNWVGEKIADAQGMPTLVGVECTAGGEVTVVYGGALGALFESYAAKRTALSLP